MLSDLARQALTAQQHRHPEDHATAHHGLAPLPRRGAAISNALIDRLREDEPVSVLDTRTVDRSRLHGPRQVTDAYLLALATAHDGRFVTFDRSLALSAVHGASEDQLTVL